MSKYSKEFVDAMDEVFKGWRKYENSGLLLRFMDDNTEFGIPYYEVLEATSLGKLKAKASRINMKHDLYNAVLSGRCYQDEEEARRQVGCPRLYAQRGNDEAILSAFTCYGVFCIPDCPKFKTGECWKRFDELGFKIKG